MNDNIFPKIKHSIKNYLIEEEGNIPRNKLLLVGSMVLLMGFVLMQDIFAKHSSHSSHSSHKSHSSHSSGAGSHSSHVSHVSHASHTSSVHASHYSSVHSSHSSAVHSSHSSHISGELIDLPDYTEPPETTAAISEEISETTTVIPEEVPETTTVIPEETVDISESIIEEYLPKIPTPNIPPLNDFNTEMEIPLFPELIVPET